MARFGSAEVFGVIDSRFTDSSVPNGIWYTLAERERSGLSPHLIVIGNDGTGNLICLDCRDEAASVVLVDPSGERTQATRIASGFGSYLLKAVTAEIET
jgi:antitoxin YobK